jgi:hypothetical protein
MLLRVSCCQNFCNSRSINYDAYVRKLKRKIEVGVNTAESPSLYRTCTRWYNCCPTDRITVLAAAIATY